MTVACSIAPTLGAGVGPSGPFAAAAVELRGYGLFPLPLVGDEHRTPGIRGFTTKSRPSLATIQSWINSKRFRAASIGVVTGAASGITVIDVDSADPAVLSKVEQRFGEALIKVKTPRGWHLYHRYAGERCANLRREGLLADVKAMGGFVVAPPSVRQSGAHAGVAYEIVKGAWGDLARLLPIKPGSLPGRAKTAEIILSSDRTPEARVVQLGAVDIGYRNCTLFRAALRQAPGCGSEQELLEKGTEVNTHFNPPLALPEVAKTICSAWGYEVRGENWVGSSCRVIAGAFEYAALAAYPDAALLLRTLRHANGARDARGEPFAASPKAMAKARVIPGWGRQRYRRALTVLVELGFLIIVHRGGRCVGDARKFAFHQGGPAMTPRLAVSNIAYDDLTRVVGALKSGLSIRKAGQTLGMDKSKVLRLKHRAEASGLFGPAVSAQPAAVSHCPTEGVSHFAGPNVRTPPALPPLPPDPKVIGRGEAFAAEEETGCLLNFSDGKSGYRPCGRPVGADGVFCEAHGGTQKIRAAPGGIYRTVSAKDRRAEPVRPGGRDGTHQN